jgi:hypothetical protein
MDKIIKIEHPYENVTLDFSQVNSHQRGQLNPFEWACLIRAERPLYADTIGAHAYTDVVHRHDSFVAAMVWEYCETSMSCSDELEGCHPGSNMYGMRIAQRVARAIGMMAFGAEWLLR